MFQLAGCVAAKWNQNSIRVQHFCGELLADTDKPERADIVQIAVRYRAALGQDTLSNSAPTKLNLDCDATAVVSVGALCCVNYRKSIHWSTLLPPFVFRGFANKCITTRLTGVLGPMSNYAVTPRQSSPPSALLPPHTRDQVVRI